MSTAARLTSISRAIPTIKISCLLFACVVSPGAHADKVTVAGEVDASKTSAPRYTRLNIQGKPVEEKSIARCVRDNETALVWELKTDDGGPHDKDHDYRWGGSGADTIGTIFFDDWNTLIKAANKAKLCGFTDWRVPAIEELKTLISPQREPTIDTDYFPYTLAGPYWSTSAYPNYPEHGQTVHFGNGTSYYYHGFRGNRLPLRLVRDSH